MSNNEQLFTEIIPSEEANLSGGFLFCGRRRNNAYAFNDVVSGGTVNGDINITVVNSGRKVKKKRAKE